MKDANIEVAQDEVLPANVKVLPDEADAVSDNEEVFPYDGNAVSDNEGVVSDGADAVSDDEVVSSVVVANTEVGQVQADVNQAGFNTNIDFICGLLQVY